MVGFLFLFWVNFAQKINMKNLISRKSQFFILLMSFSFLITISCGSDKQEKQKDLQTNSKSEAELAEQENIKITLHANDKMQFDKSEIVVYKNQTVTLELIHTGDMPKSSMGHNFVLLDNSVSISTYSKKVLKEKDNEYIWKDSTKTLAYTKMLGGGESTEITFEAPEVGEYDFICSFPGHYSNMKGKFIVK